jgi:hypothetical protein
MSDLNLTEKISEAFTNVIKKTKAFDKLDKIKFYLGSFVLISSIVSVTNLFIHYSIINRISQNRENINKNKNEIFYKMEVKQIEILSAVNNMLNEHQDKMISLLEKHQKSLDEMKKIQFIDIEKKESITTNTSISSLSIDLYQQNITEQKETNEDDELINECYDLIPLNNNKKFTGIKSWLF